MPLRYERPKSDWKPGFCNKNQVPYNTVPVFSPVFIPFVNLLPQNAVLIINFILLPVEAIIYLLAWFLMKPVALLHKWGFPAVTFGISQLNRGSLIQKAKFANYDMQPIVFCIRPGQGQTEL